MSAKLIVIETIEYIEANMKEELTAEILASRVGYSKTHFSRLGFWYIKVDMNSKNPYL